MRLGMESLRHVSPGHLASALKAILELAMACHDVLQSFLSHLNTYIEII
jgi:hypothetical protein